MAGKAAKIARNDGKRGAAKRKARADLIKRYEAKRNQPRK